MTDKLDCLEVQWNSLTTEPDNFSKQKKWINNNNNNETISKPSSYHQIIWLSDYEQRKKILGEIHSRFLGTKYLLGFFVLTKCMQFRDSVVFIVNLISYKAELDLGIHQSLRNEKKNLWVWYLFPQLFSDD